MELTQLQINEGLGDRFFSTMRKFKAVVSSDPIKTVKKIQIQLQNSGRGQPESVLFVPIDRLSCSKKIKTYSLKGAHDILKSEKV